MSRIEQFALLKMLGKISLIAVVCIVGIVAEAPLRSNHFRGQRLRQQPSHFARQQAAGPYAQAGTQPNVPFNLPTPNVDTEYGAPAAPSSQYGPPTSTDGIESGPTSNETTDNPDSENVAGAPSGRLHRFEKLRQAPRGQAQRQQKFQRLQAQQSLRPQAQLLQPLQVQAPVLQRLQVQQPLLPQTELLQRLELQPVQQEGSYFIQLPSGSIQRVNYLAQPSFVDNSVSARLQFRPLVEAQATTAAEQPQIYVNTLVQAYTNANNNQ